MSFDTILLFIVVWRLHSPISGKAYRFHRGNYCTHYDIHVQTQSRESQSLQDNDMSTCELIPNDASEVFGLFLKEPRRRLIFVSVYGKEILCSPVYGISLSITSTDHQSHACKAYFTECMNSCNFECQCPQDKSCSHITVMKSPATLADGMTEICEINMWNGSRWNGNNLVTLLLIIRSSRYECPRYLM